MPSVRNLFVFKLQSSPGSLSLFFRLRLMGSAAAVVVPHLLLVLLLPHGTPAWLASPRRLCRLLPCHGCFFLKNRWW